MEETKHEEQSTLALPPVGLHHTALASTYPRTYRRSRVPFLPRKAWALPTSDCSRLSLQGQRAAGRILVVGSLRWEKPERCPSYSSWCCRPCRVWPAAPLLLPAPFTYRLPFWALWSSLSLRTKQSKG